MADVTTEIGMRGGTWVRHHHDETEARRVIDAASSDPLYLGPAVMHERRDPPAPAFATADEP